MELGLVDELGDLDRAIDVAADLSGAPRRPVLVRARRGIRDRVLGPLADSLVSSAAEEIERRLWMGSLRY
jgi:ClpP class serine protease